MKKLAAISLMITMLAAALLVNARPPSRYSRPANHRSTIADFTLTGASAQPTRFLRFMARTARSDLPRHSLPCLKRLQQRMEKLAQDFKPAA